MRLFKSNHTPKETYEVGGGAFTLAFYLDENNPRGNYLHITTPSGVFEQKIANYAFGYLLVAARQGRISELEAYCVMLWRVTDEVYQDLGFCQDIIKAINKRDRRLMKQGATNAKAVTDAEDAGAQAFIEDVVEESHMSQKELKKKREADRKAMRGIITEKENG